MLSFFKRSTQPIDPPTYNERVLKFWAWFQEVAPAFYSAIDDGKCHSLTDETSEKVKALSPSFAWVYGHGKGGHGHSLTISGEGIESQQLLALQWLKFAPLIDGWTFYASRQPDDIQGAAIDVGGTSFNATEIWVTPVIDEENECIDLTVWHPKWPELEKKQRWTVTFLFLDEALGEYCTQSRVGEIRLENDRLADSFPLEELPEYVAETANRLGWKKILPGHTYTLFTIKPSSEIFPRGDLMTLNTSVPNLFRDHRKGKGQLEDPLADSGADYLYLSIPKCYFPKGEELDKRAELEDAMESALAPCGSGKCTGGGLGVDHCYVDLLIFDGNRSIGIIMKALEPFQLPKGSTLEYFAIEKRNKRLNL